MPVLVVGADTAVGNAITTALLSRRGEVRVFVSDPGAAEKLRNQGAKVAIGDVSDASHVGGAALNTFSAVLVAAAAADGRERSFAANPPEVYAAWAEGIRSAGVRRSIWVGLGTDEVDSPTRESAFVADDRPLQEVAAEVLDLDEAAKL